MSLDIKKTTEGSKLTVVLAGRLDTITSQQLEKELRTSVNGITEIVFEFSEVTYITSGGLRVVSEAMKVMKRQNGRMVLKNLQPDVQEVFDVTGLSKIMEIENDTV